DLDDFVPLRDGHPDGIGSRDRVLIVQARYRDRRDQLVRPINPKDVPGHTSSAVVATPNTEGTDNCVARSAAGGVEVGDAPTAIGCQAIQQTSDVFATSGCTPDPSAFITTS